MAYRDIFLVQSSCEGGLFLWLMVELNGDILIYKFKII